jgi:hypothetical protein
MQILSATDYGTRKVVRIVIDGTKPKWVEPDGKTSLASHTGDTADSDPNKTVVCTTCQLNWDIREYQFDGDDLRKLEDPADPNSPMVDLTDAELLSKATARAVAETSAPRVIAV